MEASSLRWSSFGRRLRQLVYITVREVGGESGCCSWPSVLIGDEERSFGEVLTMVDSSAETSKSESELDTSKKGSASLRQRRQHQGSSELIPDLLMLTPLEV